MIACDVFNHNDGIVNNKAGRNRKSHQGQVIERITQQVHHTAGPDQGYRHGHCRNDRCPNVPQENENNKNYEEDCDQKCSLNFLYRCSNRRGAVVADHDADRRRDRCLQQRQSGFDSVYRCDYIGPGHTGDLKKDAVLAVLKPVGVDVVDRVLHGCDVRQPDRRSFTIRNNKGPVVRGVEQLIII